MIGSTIGPYRILDKVGEGGMGEVYRARDSRLDRDVAIKILPELFAADPEHLTRFEREAKTLALLNHPHIAQIYGLETLNDASVGRALVMELVEGEDLSQRIARGPIPVADALAIARQIADALEAAHERGIIHRDLKPANIKVRDDGTVKVLDFGLAKALDPAGGSSADMMHSPTITSPATQLGVILGTAAYMAPEQAKGRAIDRRADVWAFGVVLFEMLTGMRAFEGGDISEVLASVLKDAPSHDALPSATPIAIRRLLRRCLEKNPAKRLDSMAAARIEIDDAMGEPEAAALPAAKIAEQPLWRRAWPLTASAAAGAALIVALSGVPGWRAASPGDRPVSRLLMTVDETPHHIAISPDGRRVAMILGRDPVQVGPSVGAKLVVRDLSDFAARTVTEGPAFLGNPVFSPDGTSVVFSAAAMLRRVPAAGGVAVDIAQLAAAPLGLSFDGDALLAGLGPGGIVSVSMSSGAVTALVTVKPGEHAATPQMLPGGEAVLFTLVASPGDPEWTRSQIVVQSVASGAREVVVPVGTDARLLPTGHLIYAVDGVWYGVAFDASTRRVRGLPAALVTGVRRHGFRGLILPSAELGISETGTLVYLPGAITLGPSQKSLVFKDRSGAEQPLDLPIKKYESPRLSPDGRQLAVSAEEGQESVIWTYDVAGRMALRRLTFKGSNRFPVWSPDGTRLAFQSTRDGDAGIFVSRVDGTGDERLTTPDPGTAHVPESWSRDGRFMSVSILGNEGAELWLYSLNDRKMIRQGDARSFSPLNSSLSPDGRWIAYTVRSPGASWVYVQPVPATGALVQVSPEGTGAHHPFWSHDGKELFYFTGSTLISAPVKFTPSLAFGKAVAQHPEFVSNMTGRGPLNYDVTRDGRAFLFAKPMREASQLPQVPNALYVVLNWFEELRAKVPVK